MPSEEKVQVVEELTQLLKQSTGVYLTDFIGLDVLDFTRLRRRLRDADISYRVVKNRLALLAAKEAGIEGVDEALRGPTGLAYTEQDPVAPARVIKEFADGAQGRPRLKAGLLEGRVYLDQDLETLAKLPPREVLLVQMVTAIQSPLSGLAFCLQGIIQKFVGTLHAVAEKKRDEGDGDAPSDAS